MTFKREDGVISRHAFSVISYAQEPSPASFNVNLDPKRTRINRIFHELFCNRRRPLDHLTGGDLICKLIG
jgi:hypothetical protein